MTSTEKSGAEALRAAEGGDPVLALARERFGLAYLYPYQRLVIANILDAFEEGAEPLRQIVLLPTGFGKSLCFQLPALLLQPPSLVVYPLLSLMEDQRRRLEGAGIACAVARGGLDRGERREAEAAILEGRARIVIANPESLSGDWLRGVLERRPPSQVAVDEAHCVSEWGESFRPSYLELGERLAELAPRALSAFTATASPQVFEAVARSLFGGEPFRLVAGDPDRTNLEYSVEPCLLPMPALERLARRETRPLLVFCSSRRGAEIVASELRRRLGEKEIRFYHAGLEREEKRAVEDWFFASDSGILAATCAYGMGVDKKNIRTVVHYELPSSVEAYLQEAGRAGRDGARSKAVALYSPRAEAREAEEGGRRGAEGNGGAAVRPARGGVRRLALLEYAAMAAGCRRERLLGLLGARLEAPCSGCDLCREAAEDAGQPRGAKAGPEGEREIVDLVAANPGRFDARSAAAALAGRARAEDLPCSGWAGLAGWSTSDILEGIALLRATGAIEEGKGWPRRGSLRKARGGSQAGRERAAEWEKAPRAAGALLLGLLRGLGLGGLAGFGGLGAAAASRAAGKEGIGPAVHETDIAKEGPDEEDDDRGADRAGIAHDGEGELELVEETHAGPSATTDEP